MIDSHLIIGLLGSGKTSLVSHLIAHKPANEQWAIIVNEFGQIGLDAALLTPDSNSDTHVIEIAGGCICCTTKSQLQVQLTQMIRQFHPDRIIIEATGLGHPSGIIDLLRGEFLHKIIRLHAVIAVVDSSLFEKAELASDRSPISTTNFIQQSQLADIIILNKTDIASDIAMQNAHNFFQNLYPQKLNILHSRHATVDQSILDVTAEHTKQTFFIQDNDNTLIKSENKTFSVADKEFFFSYEEYSDLISFGFIFQPAQAFNRQRLEHFIKELIQQADKQVIRLKAVFNCGRFWYGFNATDRLCTSSESHYRRDSRIEIISANKKLSTEQIKSALLECSR